MNTIARCNALIDDALAKGARLLTGGKANDTHMSPTLLDGVTRECACGVKSPSVR